MVAQHFPEPRDLRGTEEIRRAPAEVQLHDLAAARFIRGKEGDLALQRVEINVGARGVGGDDFVAAAEPAETLAEGQVEVEREPARFGASRSDETGGVRVLAELQRGRIRRVARPRAVVLAHQREVNRQRLHGPRV